MYLYQLPTTGAISFFEFCVDHTGEKVYNRHIPDASQARANLRGVLKDSKRADHGEKDFLGLVKIIEEYLPYIHAIISCVAQDEISLKTEPVFSWRTTLSANLFNNSPRLDVPGLHADYAFTLLTYAFAFSDLAHVIVDSVGNYERDPAITEAERQAKEEKLNVAVDFLCRASGVFTFLSDTVLPEWETSRVSPPNFHKPPDLTREVSNSLAKFVARMALADAQTLAIRRLMSKSNYDSNVTPGPPLPASHRPPSLLAKLHIECASLYSSARTLASTLGSSKSSSKDSSNKEVSSDLRRYLSDQATFHSAMARKWLGVDAGEKGGTEKAGEAVAFLQWARKELEELKDGGKLVSIGTAEKEKADERKDRINSELASVNVFYKYYKKMNDTLHFQPVPTQQDLQSRIPGGRIAIPAKPYVPPKPAFGPGSLEYANRKAEQLSVPGLSDCTDKLVPTPSVPSGNYAGAGAYF